MKPCRPAGNSVTLGNAKVVFPSPPKAVPTTENNWLNFWTESSCPSHLIHPCGAQSKPKQVTSPTYGLIIETSSKSVRIGPTSLVTQRELTLATGNGQ